MSNIFSPTQRQFATIQPVEILRSDQQLDKTRDELPEAAPDTQQKSSATSSLDSGAILLTDESGSGEEEVYLDFVVFERF